MAELHGGYDHEIPRIAPLYRLQWEAAQGAWVLLFPEGMIKLNSSGGEILKRCDGARSLAAIVGEINRAFDADVGNDVRSFLRLATERRWIDWHPSPSEP
jgi:pyrroloquinoline quinone biosynthesis protein D